MNNNFSKVLVERFRTDKVFWEKAQQVSTAAGLFDFAAENGIQMTMEQAEELFPKLKKFLENGKELIDEDLAEVSGGATPRYWPESPDD